MLQLSLDVAEMLAFFFLCYGMCYLIELKDQYFIKVMISYNIQKLNFDFSFYLFNTRKWLILLFIFSFKQYTLQYVFNVIVRQVTMLTDSVCEFLKCTLKKICCFSTRIKISTQGFFNEV